MNTSETSRKVSAFGGEVTIFGSGKGLPEALDRATVVIESIHDKLTRFDPDSELCRLNADPRTTVPVSPLMLRFLEAAVYAGGLSGGLVDSTCLDAVEQSGYTESLTATGSHAPSAVKERSASPAIPHPGSWRDLEIDPIASTVNRPPGLRVDAGGLGKGMAADLAADELDHLDSFAVECLGEIRLGGSSVGPREIRVASPEANLGPVATLHLQEGAIATSGTTKRSWVGRDGRTSHHLIDPRTGTPVYSGLIQVTAQAPTALEAEVRAKSALIAGPRDAAAMLPHGGVIVRDDFRAEATGGFALTGGQL